MIDVDEIQKILNEAGICAEVEQEMCPSLIEITITWGDWKHDHGCLQYLMQQQGLTYVKGIILEENGSDCYSAKHIFGEDHFVEAARKIFQPKQ